MNVRRSGGRNEPRTPITVIPGLGVEPPWLTQTNPIGEIALASCFLGETYGESRSGNSGDLCIGLPGGSAMLLAQRQQTRSLLSLSRTHTEVPMLSTPSRANVHTFRNFVGGQWTEGTTASVFERRNPADRDDLIGTVPSGSAADVEAAVAAASVALADWSETPAPQRGELLMAAARLLRARGETIARNIVREQGKTYAEAQGEVTLGLAVLEYMAGEGRRLQGVCLPSEVSGRFIYTRRQPVGIVGLITPWNFPLGVPLWKLAPALVCGNTVVWKSARLTPLTSAAIMELFIDAGLPAGVVNLVNGAGVIAGAALVKHPAVRAISFTSSLEVGKMIYVDAAQLFKKVQAEAGSKNAAVVLADADLDWAAECISTGAFRYAGQRCTATSRVVVVDQVADALVERLVAKAGAIHVGNGLKPDVTMGAIADDAQLRRIISMIDRGSREAILKCGGHRLKGPEYDAGLFVAPTVFDHVPACAEIAQEEVFGPVLSITRVSDSQQAITVANANGYGMAAAVFSNDADRLTDAAEKLDCGIVHCNAPTTGAEVHVPFGGIKNSGVGEREMGGDAINFYSEQKVVYMNRRPQK